MNFRAAIVRSRGARRQWFVAGLTIFVPVLIGLAFPHPMTRPVIPLALMFFLIIVVAMTDGLLFALLAAVSSTLSVWYFNFPPGFSFRVDDSEDVYAIMAMGAIALLSGTLVSMLRERDVRSAVSAAEQRLAISTMQRALLPERMPDTRGLAVGWQYQTGGTVTSPVGGDWVAFIPLDHARFGLAVGDVAGHGLDAVTAMAEFRYATRVLAADGSDPSSVIARVHATAQLFGRPTFSTCVYGVVDTTACTLTFTNAGHPPPIIVRGAHTITLDDKHGPPLGVDHHLEYGSSVVELQAADLLALYTDGLVERRDVSLDDGIARLQNRLRAADSSDLGHESREIIHDLVGDELRDDVALVLVQLAAGDSSE